jgi:hypothetical protein
MNQSLHTRPREPEAGHQVVWLPNRKPVTGLYEKTASNPGDLLCNLNLISVRPCVFDN